MPFTFAHPAIVLPLINKKKKFFSATGLIIGCMIPDFESFIFFRAHKSYSHTWPGVFWFDLPFAIIFTFVFHYIIRDPLIRNLPGAIKKKFTNFTGFRWLPFFRKHPVMVIISSILGIVSHLLWDALTHLNLADPDAINSPILFKGHHLDKILQYSNSLIGIAILTIYIMWLPAAEEPADPEPEQQNMIFQIKPPRQKRTQKVQYWIIVFCTLLLTAVISLNIITDYIDIILLIDIVISGCLLGLIVAPPVQKIISALS